MIAAPARSLWSGPTVAAASDFRAGADWDVDPGIRVPSLLGFARARMRRGLAVVLRCSRDSLDQHAPERPIDAVIDEPRDKSDRPHLANQRGAEAGLIDPNDA